MSTSTNVRCTEDRPRGVVLRSLGAFERLYYRYTEHNPMHFAIAVQFDSPLQEVELRAALAAVQHRHPLLTAHVEDRPSTRLCFVRAEPVPPVGVTVVDHDPDDWQPAAARELSRTFDRSTAPLMRAVLIGNVTGSTIVLTFDHTVADGISAALIIDDLTSALNGQALEPLPVPPSQEDMIDRTLPSVSEQPAVAPAAVDPRMAVPSSIRPFDAATPHLHTLALSTDITDLLVKRCRDQKTTVHAAIVTAASHVRSQDGGGGSFVRVVTPFNFRRHIGADRDCANYFTATRTGMAPSSGASFWDQARTVNDGLADARSVDGVLTTSAATRQLIPVDATAETAEGFLLGGLSYELMVSNLGIRTVGCGPRRPTALWGPILMCQVEGECVTGVTTYDGRLRMVACGHSPTAAFLDGVRTALLAACTT